MDTNTTDDAKLPPVTGSQDQAGSRCDCLDKIEKVLTKRHGPGVELELSAWMDSTTYQPKEGLHPLRYSYKDGKKRKRSYVSFNFCPFCGKRQGN